MVVSHSDQHTLAPAEQYLRTLWDARWLYISIVATFIIAAVVANALLPKIYSSQALVSVRPAPQLDSAGLLYDSVISSRGQTQPDLGEQSVRRYLKRLHANRTVTLAARDAGVIDEKTGIDDRDINTWIEVELIEKTDLVAITVNQGTPEIARKFAQTLLDRTFQVNREENAAADTRKLLVDGAARTQAEVAAAEARFLEASRSTGPGAAKVALDRATMELDQARKAYAGLKKRLDAIDLILAEQQLQLYVVDPPTLPARPSFPRPLLNISLGLILGILTATVIVVLRGIFRGPTTTR
jgi:uncharacterized protein involved in exopolysaccharide biosynthesis